MQPCCRTCICPRSVKSSLSPHSKTVGHGLDGYTVQVSSGAQVNAKDCAATGRIEDLHTAAMLIHDLPHEVKAEATSGGTWSKAVKRLEDALALEVVKRVVFRRVHVSDHLTCGGVG